MVSYGHGATKRDLGEIRIGIADRGWERKLRNRGLEKTVGTRRSRVPDVFFKTEFAKFSASLRSIIVFLYAV